MTSKTSRASASTLVQERVSSVAAACSRPGVERRDIATALADVARIESWAASRRGQLVRRLSELPGAFPEADIADSTGTTLNAATKETERASTLERVEPIAEALEAGDIRPGHVDAVTRATNKLDEEQTATLLDQADELARMAAQSSIGRFETYLNRKVKNLQTEADAEERFERQRRNTKLKYWVDKDDGMWCMSGRFDPKTGAKLQRTIDSAVSSLFAESTPDSAPADRFEKQQHLNALALARLIEGGHGLGQSRPGNPVVVLDVSMSASEPPVADWGFPIEVPESVLREVFRNSDPETVIVANGAVLYAPGQLDLGRTRRLASRDQRRALRGLYSTCAVPGCSVHYDRCRLHHVTWWRNGGRTDLNNLVPMCTHHHTKLHAEQWQMTLGPNRELSIRFPDGTHRATGPPKRGAA